MSFRIFDTIGEEKFKSIGARSVEDKNAVLISGEETADAIKKWATSAKEKITSHSVFLVHFPGKTDEETVKHHAEELECCFITWEEKPEMFLEALKSQVENTVKSDKLGCLIL